ncbi:RDD family protein, partial [Streptomyces sp. GC420]|uniref:RDD family protein n=1 Tax=Streptomyces sp. GC420 TaxID=2697568 RepID=UPI0014150031
DPSIPGYVRYWNGVSWVPGTSRPAPAKGEQAPAPAEGPEGDAPASAPGSPGGAAAPAAPAAPAVPAPSPAPAEETGPVFLDEDPPWRADPAQQDRDGRVSWGAGTAGSRSGSGPDPRQNWPEAEGSAAAPVSGEPWQTPGRRPADRPSPAPSVQAGDLRRGATAQNRSRTDTPGAPGPGAGAGPGVGAGGGAGGGTGGAAPESPVWPAPETAETPGTMTMRPAGPGAQRTPADAQASGPAAPVPQQFGTDRRTEQGPAADTPQAPAQQAPMASGPGGGASSWPQQVHQLARSGEERADPVVPWKPPVVDPFLAAVQAQAAARPAGLGRRFAARLVDTLALALVMGAAAVPVAPAVTEHIDEKIEAAKLTGETVTVWLLDGTTSLYLGILLGVFLIFGVLYEVLPTVKWGRTAGKKLFKVQVRDIEAHEPPGFGAALRRWLVYGVLGLLVVGVVNVLWCLFDRPWRQCWHDKAARTFVAAD